MDVVPSIKPHPRRKRAKKPADMPKRPLSAYNIYFQAQKEIIMAKHVKGEAQEDFVLENEKTAGAKGPAIFRALAKTIGQRWKALPDDERKIYQDKAQDETAAYRQKMEEYHRNMVKVQQRAQMPDSGGDLHYGSYDGGATRGKNKKPADMPKRPLSAYNLFFKQEKDKIMEAQRNGEPQADFKIPDEAEVARRAAETGKRKTPVVFQALARCIGSRWKALTPDQKKTFEEQAEMETKAYRQKMEEYNKNLLVTKLGSYKLPNATAAVNNNPTTSAAREDQETVLVSQDETRVTDSGAPAATMSANAAPSAAAPAQIDSLLQQQQQAAPQIAAFGASAAMYGGGMGGMPFGFLPGQQQQQQQQAQQQLGMGGNDAMMAYLRAGLGQPANLSFMNPGMNFAQNPHLNASSLMLQQQQQQQLLLQQQHQQQQAQQENAAQPSIKTEFHV